MTDDASPENLRKFLESDDPAMVRMGISLAKGAGVEVTVKDLERFLKSEDVETVKTGFILAEEAGVGDEAMEMLCELLGDDDDHVRWLTASVLGEIGDARAVETLIKALRNKDANHGELIDVLAQTGDLGALCGVLEAYNCYLDWETRSGYMEVLADTGDPRALDVIWCDWSSSKDRRYYRQAECVAMWCGSAEEDSPEYESALNYLTSILGRLNYLEVPFPSGDRAVDALIRVIQEQVDDVGFGWPHDPRYYAAMELGDIGDTRAVEPLKEALGDEDDEVRKAAAEALAKLGWKPDTDKLRTVYLLAKGDALARLAAAGRQPTLDLFAAGEEDALVEWGEPEFKQFTKALGDNEMIGVRKAAAEMLGSIGDARAVEPLINALRDGDRDVCRSAAEALDKFGWKPGTDGQKAAYLISNDAWESLVEWGEPAVEPLINALEDGNSAAAEALVKIDETRAVEPLIKALEDDNWKVRRVAARALGEIGDAHAVEPLIKALGDENDDNDGVNLRAAAVAALGEIGDTRAVDPLIKVLEENESWVRDTAAKALDKLGWKPETDELRGTYLISTAAWESLVEWGEPAVEPLIKALGDNGMIGVRRSVAEALGAIGDERAVEPLIETLRYEGSDVRRSAAEALGEIGDGRAVEPLIEALEDEGYGVAKAAKKALKKLGHEVK
jgi:HEAT repeat protein